MRFINIFKKISLLNNSRIQIASLLLVATSFLLLIISRFPNYFTDDYLVFAIIKKNYFNFLMGSENEYFLKTRPFSYFDFQIYFALLNSAFLIKVCNAIIFLIYIVISFFTFNSLLKLTNQKTSVQNIILSVSFIFANHDNHIMVFWISNLTELFSILFYSTSILFFSKWLIDKEKERNYWFGAIMFLFSLLFKQQGLHLPFLLILYFLLTTQKLSSKTIIYIGLIFLLMILYSIWNWIEYSSFTNNAFENLWKKPFAIIGTLFFVASPYLAEPVYNYFVSNKLLACFLLMGLVTGISFYLIWYKRNINLKRVLFYSFFLLLIFYPRIFAHGGGRLNSVLIFWFAFGMINLISKSKSIKYFIIILTIFNLFTSFIMIETKWKNEEKIRRDIITELKKFTKNFNQEAVIICSPFYKELIYESNYIADKSFEKDSAFHFGGCKMLYSFDVKRKYLSVYQNQNNEIIIKSNSKKINFEYYANNNFTKLIREKMYPISNNISSFRLRLNPGIKNNFKLIFYNGRSWEEI